jgi:hypothetical protein
MLGLAVAGAVALDFGVDFGVGGMLRFAMLAQDIG